MLRITGGEHRGRKLKVPKVEATRPLVSRAREGLFNHLRERVPGAAVWDVCAGSGILGLEALSRGAASVVAVERSGRACAQLRENAALLGCEERLALLRMDAHRLADPGWAPPAGGGDPDLVFYDPPYDDFRRGGEARRRAWALFLALARRLRPGGAAVVHAPRGLLSEEECGELPGIERRDYGSTSLYWWHRDSAGGNAGTGPGESEA